MARSLSHNLLSRLGTSSGAPGTALRPNLNRSKSTDSVSRPLARMGLTRNNRLLVKLSALQPLSRTVLGPTLTSNRSSGSLKGLGASTSGIRTSSRKGKAILRLNDDNQDYEDIQGEEGGDRREKEQLSKENDDENAYLGDQETTPSGAEGSRTASRSSVLGDPEARSEHSGAFEAGARDSEADTASQMHENDTEEEINHINGEHLAENTATGIPRSPKTPGAAEAEAHKSPKSAKSAQSANVLPPEQMHSDLGVLKSTSASSEDFQSAAPLAGSVASNFYGGSLLLSQLTGLTRKVDYAQPYPTGPHPSLENTSGISFMANPIESANYHNLAEPVISGRNAVTPSSYQPEQTIYSNLQRTNSQYSVIGARKPPSQAATNNMTSNSTTNSNLNTILTGLHGKQVQNSHTNQNSNSTHAQNSHNSTPLDHHNIETRTQQRLWLQRENSLMDVGENHNFSLLSLNKLMFSHNYSLGNVKELASGAHLASSAGSSQHLATPHDQNPTTNSISGLFRMLQTGHNSIQSRTDFERLNREYLNVRRHLNPVGKSLSRLEKLEDDASVKGNRVVVKKRTKAAGSGSSTASGNSTATSANANSFREFSSHSPSQEQELSANLNRLWQQALVLSLASSTNGSPGSKNQRQPMNHKSSSFNMRSPQTPTTRAVKLKQRAN